MSNNRLFYTLLFTCLSTNTFANFAQVTKLKGEATYLSPGMLEAKKVELNQWLPKDTSLLTNEKTFLIITYKTGSTVTLGPASKLVIDSGVTKDQQLVTLLVGKIKASVINNKKDETNKMLIKTKGAALGIRGTEFQTSYNPESKITSLITFHGAVAMTKLNENAPTTISDLTKIEKKLESNSVVVKLGEYSGVTENVKEVTAPVRIAPEQFTKLKINETLSAIPEKIEEKVYKEELTKTIKSYEDIKVSEKDNTAKDITLARAGGYVEVDSGLYLPPPKTAEKDEKLSIYKVTEQMGKVDDGGQYVPPQGLVLDIKKGFIVDDKAVEKTEVVAVAKELNEAVSKQVAPVIEEKIKKKNSLDKTEEDVYKKYYDPNKY